MINVDRLEQYVGKDIWVCAIKFKNYSKRCNRHVPPTKVKVILRSNSQYQQHRYEFIPYNKNGELSKSKTVKLYDNTTLASPLMMSPDEKRCRAYYSEECRKTVEGLMKVKESIEKQINIFGGEGSLVRG